jgi:8-oxo-dGTP pyrophosphatase MutT (NUDIX family)
VTVTLLDPVTYYAQRPTVFTAAGALITDKEERVLVVKPNYRDYWLVPGGMIEADETPEVACARELEEELGLALPVGRLLVLDWAPPFDDRPRPLVHFLFDGGTLADPGAIVLQDEELDDYAFVDVDRAAELTRFRGERLPAALAARKAGTTTYLPEAIS